MSSYLSQESNSALCMHTTTIELQIGFSKPRGKIVQNLKFSPVSQNSDLSSKLESTRQNESRGMLGFQNRALEAYKLKLHTKQCKRVS